MAQQAGTSTAAPKLLFRYCLPKNPMKMNARTVLFSSLFMVPALALASEVEQAVVRCAVIGDASARLACFDAVAKAQPANAPPIGTAEPAEQPEPAVQTVHAGTLSGPAQAARLSDPAPTKSPISSTVQRWELDDASKRGTFVFRPHRDTYLLLANYSTSRNNKPFSNVGPDGINAQKVELTYQLSFKVKMAEEIAGSPIDLWFGYTQESFWQAYNRAESSPFRETNYQPELMAVMPLGLNLAGLNFRYINLALVHQSNGQALDRSRSWNRVYAELGVERGNFALASRIWRRLDNGKSDNDNIDITDFMGHGDLRATYRDNGHEYSLLARLNWRTGHGALQAGWAFPLSNNLKGYVQLFSGYGQSLIDYNYAQKSLGGGFLVEF